PLPEAPAAHVPRDQRPAVLELEGLSKTFPLLKGAILKRRVGWVYAVSNVDFDIREGEALGLVGESGCGKTSTLLEIMNPRPPAVSASGSRSPGRWPPTRHCWYSTSRSPRWTCPSRPV